jgi:hypothetical protein
LQKTTTVRKKVRKEDVNCRKSSYNAERKREDSVHRRDIGPDLRGADSNWSVVALVKK